MEEKWIPEHDSSGISGYKIPDSDIKIERFKVTRPYPYSYNVLMKGNQRTSFDTQYPSPHSLKDLKEEGQKLAHGKTD